MGKAGGEAGVPGLGGGPPGLPKGLVKLTGLWDEGALGMGVGWGTGLQGGVQEGWVSGRGASGGAV